MQLEEANRTLTSDVANLANEKEELNNKLKAAIEGTGFISLLSSKELQVYCWFVDFPQNHKSQTTGSSRSAR